MASRLVLILCFYDFHLTTMYNALTNSVEYIVGISHWYL